MRKTAKSNLNSTFQMTIDTLSTFHLLEYCSINKSTLTITLPNESVFLFYGCDDSEKLKSIAGITDIICEEATELTLDDFTQLDLRLRCKEEFPQIYCMLNPVSKSNWVYLRWFAPNVELSEDTFVLRTTYKDNRFLSADYISTLLQLATTNPTYYKIYALGEFSSLDKLVFNNWRVQEFNIEDLRSLQLLVGLDFGYVNDITAITASLLDEKNKKIYIFKEYGETGKTNQEIANVIKSLGFAKSIIIADSAEQKSIEEIRRQGILRIKPSVKGNDSVIHGIQKLQQYEIIVSPECEGVITELQNYAWIKDKATSIYINKPIDAFNHYIDALRYSLQCVSADRLKVMDSALLGL